MFVGLYGADLWATGQRDYPDSLFFLDPTLADATMAHNDQSRVMETFLTNPSGDETDIGVKNVTFGELGTPPYKASVDFDKRLFAPGTRQERKRETLCGADGFRAPRRRPERLHSRQFAGDSDYICRVDQAFEEPRR